MSLADGTLLPFPSSCRTARLLRRENRFVVEVEVDVEVEDRAERFRVHCNNTGSMGGLLRAGAEVLISYSSNPKRRLPYTLELIRVEGVWVGVNTLTPNRLLRAAWEAGLLPWAQGLTVFRPEVRVGASRLDAKLDSPDDQGVSLWVEAKNVTLAEGDRALFPDAVTARGLKHLEECVRLVEEGSRAALFFLVQRGDVRHFGPAHAIDPAYSEAFWRALDAGVEMRPHLAHVSPEGIGLGEPLPLIERA